MSNKSYILEFNGQQVATIDNVGYETPWFHGTCHYTDDNFQEKMEKVCSFESKAAQMADDDNMSDEKYDELYTKELSSRGLSENDVADYKKAKWTITVSDGTVMKIWEPILENGDISWRPYNS